MHTVEGVSLPSQRGVGRCGVTVAEIKDAIERGNIYAVFQPQVSARSFRIVGMELLARWRRADDVEVPAKEFIQLIESSDLEWSLFRLLLRSAATACAGLAGYDGSFSINASPWLLSQKDFSSWLVNELKESDLNKLAERLTIEVTERAAVGGEMAASLAINLRHLVAEGIQLSLDDFGQGGASMFALERYDYQQVKIDKYFVHRARATDKALAVLSGMVELARATGALIVLEGIETLGDVLIARKVDADMLQGYLLGKPRLLEDFQGDWMSLLH